MKLIPFLILPFFLSGCVYLNDRGLSINRYDDCKEVYDSMGYYHKECPDVVLEYKEAKELTEKAIEKIDYFELLKDKKQEDEIIDEFYGY